MKTICSSLLTIVALLSFSTHSSAQEIAEASTDQLKAVRLPGLPGALRGRLDVDAKTWPQTAEVQLETLDQWHLGSFWTKADATLDLPEPGYHSFVKVFAASTKGLSAAQDFDVTVKVADAAGSLIGSATVGVDPAQPPPVVAMVYGPSKEVKAKIKIEVVRSGAKDRVVVSIADDAFGLASGVNVEVAGFDAEGKPVGSPKPLSLGMVRSFVRVQASGWDADPILDAAGVWQQTLPTVWSLDSSGDGKADLFGDVMLDLDIRDVALGASSINLTPEGKVELDFTLRASSVQYLLGGLDVWLWDEVSDIPSYFWLAAEALRPEFLVEIPFTADPMGNAMEVAVQLYNKEGKFVGVTETCILTVEDKAQCKTPSGMVLRVGGWGGGSWAGSGSTTVSSSVQLRVLAPAQPTFEPAIWPEKVGVSVAVKSDKLKVAGPATLVGSRTTWWNAVDATPQEGLVGSFGESSGPFTVQIRTRKGVDAPVVGATFRVEHWGIILIDEVKLEVE